LQQNKKCQNPKAIENGCLQAPSVTLSQLRNLFLTAPELLKPTKKLFRNENEGSNEMQKRQRPAK
jgi:hypothetical protein